MANKGSSSNIQQSHVPMFDGENYDFWAVKMKTIFRAKGLWEIVETGYTEPAMTDCLLKNQKKNLKEKQQRDAYALSYIQRGVSDSVFPKIMGAAKAKEAWEILQQEFQGNSKIKLQHNFIPMDPIASFHENEIQLPSKNPQLEHSVEAKREDDEFWPLSGKPYFSVVFSISHVKPKYHLSLPAKLHGVLPRGIVPAVVTCCGKNWETVFHGEGSLKRFASSTWKQFVIDNDLKIGDALVFELMESSNEKLKFRVQILRGDFPAELLEKVSGRSTETVILINDD